MCATPAARLAIDKIDLHAATLTLILLAPILQVNIVFHFRKAVPDVI